MITKIVTLILAAITINFACATSAFAQTDKDAQRSSQVKHEVEKLGFDERVEVRLAKWPEVERPHQRDSG